MSTAIYQKSAKGAEAIATRSAALSPKLRSVLIMVDGKRSLEDLVKLAQGLGEGAQLLGELMAHGYIEPAGAQAGVGSAAAPGATSAPAPLAPAGKTVTLVEAQRFASRRITDLIGPDAAVDLCLRIEKTRNAQEFTAALHRAEQMLRQYGGARMAADFAAEMEAHRPA